MTSPETMTASRFWVEPLSPTIGAEIHGVDLTQSLPDADRDELLSYLHQWKVIFFRDQQMTSEQHLTLGRRFGELEIHPFAKKNDQHPELLKIRHDADLPGSENIWHSDVTWRLAPSLGSILHLKQTPRVGGDTLFADMNAAYLGLPESIRSQVSGLTALHDFSAFRRRMKQRGVSDHQLEAFDRDYPNPEHPVIRTHPNTGAQSIFVNRAFTRRILGVSDNESDRLLTTLYAQASLPEYQCRFRWTDGSVAFWDNRACQHYAVSDYWPNERTAERVTIVGDKPFYRPTPIEVDTLAPQFRGVIRRHATGEIQDSGLALGQNEN